MSVSFVWVRLLSEILLSASEGVECDDADEGMRFGDRFHTV